MSVGAKLKLKDTKLLWPQTTRCYTEIANDTEETLKNINPYNWKGSATISLTNIETGETTYYARTLLTEMESPGHSLLSGGSFVNEIVLSDLLRFPSCGGFELRAHYEWNEGQIDSDPAKVEILSSNPQSLITATSLGSQIGDVFCVWINRDQEGNSLFLSMIDTGYEPKFEWSNKIGEITGSANLSISVPANRIPRRQYIAWISGNKLNYVIYENEEFQSNVFELDADDYEIIPPLLEVPAIEGVQQNAEVLLLQKGSDSWQMRTVLLDDSPAFGNNERKIQSVPPQWFQTVYRSNEERYTFILLPQSRDGNPYTKLAMCLWKARLAPAKPVFLTNWQGELVTADVLLAGDDRIVGAGLVKQQAAEKTEYVIQKWQIGKNDDLTLTAMAIVWNEKWPIKHAILRVNGEGTPFMLIKGGPEGKWFWVDGAGEISSLGELSTEINLPANIIFVSYIYPVILYTDKTCGLKLHYLGPKRVYRPPTGAW